MILNNKAFRFWAFIALPILLIVVSDRALPGYYGRLTKLVGINVILAASLSLCNGFTGIFSMGHAGFMAIGAYASALITIPSAKKAVLLRNLPGGLQQIEMPLLPALLIGGLIAALVALAIGFPVLRFKGHYLSVATLGLIVIIRSVLQNNPDYTNGAKGLTGIAGLSDTFTIYGVMVVMMYILHRILHSAYGRSMIAIRDDIAAAESLGVGLARHRLLAFSVSAFMAAVAGGLWAHVQKVISPSFFYYDRTFVIVETSIIGGMYSLSGAVVGALIMTFVPEYLSSFESSITLFGHPLYGAAQLMLSALMIVIIIFRRKGIMGYSDIIVDSWFDGSVYKSAVDPRAYRALGRAVVERFSGKRSGSRT
ncbi:MAG: branched-chain amino acid ABC transporter permease [Clostridiales bacterium]|nr:branched-chain amino acid ABC transporter permease [Clostridiales bacterium]